MRISNDTSDPVVLRELGERLARTRLERNVTQAGLAESAGVSKATVERIEGGGEVRSGSLIRVLRALDLLEALDRLVPEPLPSPVERLRTEGRRRRRARPPRGRPADGGSPWSWGETHDAGGEP